MSALHLVTTPTGAAGELTQTQHGDGFLLSADVNADGAADFLLQVDTLVKLTQADFVM
jgi:hypothetical protein